MAQKVKVRKVTKTKARVKKGSTKGYRSCNMCHGTGRIKT